MSRHVRCSREEVQERWVRTTQSYQRPLPGVVEGLCQMSRGERSLGVHEWLALVRPPDHQLYNILSACAIVVRCITIDLSLAIIPYSI